MRNPFLRRNRTTAANCPAGELIPASGPRSRLQFFARYDYGLNRVVVVVYDETSGDGKAVELSVWQAIGLRGLLDTAIRGALASMKRTV
ncbi:hypothetical protein [Nocardia sp. BMG51109]|uniref:hypothetical protein n=1 Tax=Nocardia sp. BMG51109 TaxID=1056816 RepID=UPI0012EB621B|nr:hypothetical protein [Nocardia sp. BMG51109]